ncbi:hypothetical protein L3Y34_005583 [Caenorhabditis briggsae]|uniref:Uncharacterized protein n=1 Tax=Caenorhabditis briggsae TaxID=6238 RepID=A0AAE9AJM4_CAEBR|nr:hypothetical protein L3Y34_005583 [Caenorhabditis briggsae]
MTFISNFREFHGDFFVSTFNYQYHDAFSGTIQLTGKGLRSSFPSHWKKSTNDQKSCEDCFKSALELMGTLEDAQWDGSFQKIRILVV